MDSTQPPYPRYRSWQCHWEDDVDVAVRHVAPMEILGRIRIAIPTVVVRNVRRMIVGLLYGINIAVVVGIILIINYLYVKSCSLCRVVHIYIYILHVRYSNDPIIDPIPTEIAVFFSSFLWWLFCVLNTFQLSHSLEWYEIQRITRLTDKKKTNREMRTEWGGDTGTNNTAWSINHKGMQKEPS